MDIIIQVTMKEWANLPEVNFDDIDTYIVELVLIKALLKLKSQSF